MICDYCEKNCGNSAIIIRDPLKTTICDECYIIKLRLEVRGK